MNAMRLVKILKVFGRSTAENLHYPHQVCPADMFTSAWPLTGRDWRRPGERRRRIGEPLGRALRFRESSPEKRLAVLQLFFLVTSPTHYGVRAAKRRRGQARCEGAQHQSQAREPDPKGTRSALTSPSRYASRHIGHEGIIPNSSSSQCATRPRGVPGRSSSCGAAGECSTSGTGPN